MPKQAFCQILEIAYTVTITITPTPESAQSHNGPLVTRNPVSYYIIGGSQTILIRAKPLIVQNKMDSIGKIYTDYRTKSTFRKPVCHTNNVSSS